jgi:light-harvesting complex I chlorophyll a/b binding protein 1
MPFMEVQPLLDGSMAGDVGFDPLGLSNINGVGLDLYWMREAELKHSRLSMLAAAGFFWAEAVGGLPGFPAAQGKCQTDVFWTVLAEKPNAVAAGLLFISMAEGFFHLYMLRCFVFIVTIFWIP